MADKIRLEKDYVAEYEPTDSEDDYSEGEKELLREVRKGRDDPNRGTKKELMAFADSDDDQDDDDNEDEADENSDDDEGDDMHDSDIEGAGDDDDDGIPNSMDWGSKRGNYYSTDFIDPDYDNYTAEQAEMAKQEEEEALAIQKRLAKQMREEDFLIDTDFYQAESKDASKIEDKKTADTTKLKADFSGLSQREKQQLFQKDSPEFAALVSDFKTLMEDVENLFTPILKYVAEHKVPMIPAFEFTEVYRNLALTYCTNIGFYLLLKAKRVNVRNHPITKRLAQLKKLLYQLQDKYDNIIKPQLEALLERIVDGDEFEVLVDDEPVAVKKIKKSKLSIIDKYNEADEKAVVEDDIDVDMDAVKRAHDMLGSTDDEDDASEDEVKEGKEDKDLNENARRGITYEIAKNKGLTPHRKKEARNPRVKHRSKFRKALIRRKGAVRTVRTETKRYGGEISGIKSTVVKSVKFKT